MKCPIKLSPATAKFIKDNGLVYIGVGNPESDILVKDGRIVCESLRVMPNGEAGGGINMADHFGGLDDNHYFIRRADAAKHFPDRLPKPRPKLRYFIPAQKGEQWIMAYGTHDGGAGQGHSYDYSGKYLRPLGGIEGVLSCVADGRWAEVSKAEALARVKSEAKALLTPPKTELELVKEELAAAFARISELEARIASARKTLS